MSEWSAKALESRVRTAWANPTGFYGWLTQVNHRSVGVRFMLTSFIFFVLAGIEALVIRLQLGAPLAEVISPAAYNQLFTMHGSSMMFLFAVPFLEGLAIYLVPLMIGTRDMAFPRLNAFGYWVYLIAGLTLQAALLLGIAPDAGWFNYPPLAGPGYSRGPNIDLWVTMITFIEVSALSAAVELIVTILRQRAPGMSLARMPIFVWGALVTAFMIVFAMPALIATSLLLLLDRFIGTHFFNVVAGGEPLLWQHLFWFFGHPDVYIIMVPALGIASAIIPTCVRRPLESYTLVTLSIVAIGFISFGLWVHHMYAAGLPLLGMTFFAAASKSITIPAALIIFAWIVTIWRGRPIYSVAFLFVIGFIVLLILGGITGVMVAAAPLDWQVHDTYFVVAHFHYVLIGGAVFPIFAALYHWFPKFTGRSMSERLGAWHFWSFFVGFNVTFFPMHILGFQGMPRRIYTFQPGLGWEPLNIVATIGAFGMALSVAIFVINVAWSWAAGRKAGPNPWGGAGLEWATESPPELYNFLTIPVVQRRDPLWDAEPMGSELCEQLPSANIDDPARPLREVLATSMLDATPRTRVVLPGPSIWPLWLALALTVAVLGAMLHVWLVPMGGVLATVALLGWHWRPSETPVEAA